MGKRNYYSALEGKAVGVSSRIEALAYLLDNYTRHSADERPYPLVGLSLILSDLAFEVQEIAEKLAKRPPLDTEIELNEREERI